MMEVVQTCLSANKYRQGTFHYCGGPVKRVLTCFSADVFRESSFHRGTSLVKHVHTAKTTKSHDLQPKVYAIHFWLKIMADLHPNEFHIYLWYELSEYDFQ